MLGRDSRHRSARPSLFPGVKMDLLIRQGRLVDGTGRPARPADVVVEDGLVRAIEAPDSLIHGENPLGCTRDESGNCVAIAPCGGNTPEDDDCLSEAEPRAWSSPIYIDYGEESDSRAVRVEVREPSVLPEPAISG